MGNWKLGRKLSLVPLDGIDDSPVPYFVTNCGLPKPVSLALRSQPDHITAYV